MTDEIKKLTLTKSSLGAYWTCENRYFEVYHNLLVPKKREDYFALGDFFHLGAAVGSKYKDVSKAVAAILERVLEDPTVKHGVPSDELQLLASKAKWLVELYFNEYGFEEDVTLNEKEFPEVYIGKIGEMIEVYYSGRVDAMKGKYVLERKTAAAISSRMCQSFHQDPQGTGYTLLVPGAEGVIYDLISKANNPEKRFHRETVPIPEIWVTRYKQFILDSAERMISVLYELRKPDRNLFACVPMIGAPCAIRPICFIKDPKVRQSLIESYFIKLDKVPDLIGYEKYLKED